MLGKLMKGLRGEREAPPALPVVGEAALGRSVRIDPSMLASLEAVCGEAVSPDLVITGQGVIEMADDSGVSWLHRFYDDEHRMLQAMTTEADGGDVLEWSFYVPAGADYVGVGEDAGALRARLTKPTFAHGGETYARLWYEGDAGDQPPTEFTEVVYEEADMSDGRPLPQACMVYGREAAAGEVLLLAILTGGAGDARLERMLGTGLRPHHIGV